MGGTTPEKSDVTSELVDFRQAPLGQLSAAATLARLCPTDGRRVAVAAFNASL